jgi:hypothetical protein
MPDDTQEKLMLLTAVLFGIRMFRSPVEDSLLNLPGDELPKWREGEAQLRAEAAERSALDAAAILAAVAKIPGQKS